MVEWTRIAGSKAIRAVGREDTGGINDIPLQLARIHVRFKRGKTYVYNIRNEKYFDRFISAASKGRYYCFVIKARFDYVRKY